VTASMTGNCSLTQLPGAWHYHTAEQLSCALHADKVKEPGSHHMCWRGSGPGVICLTMSAGRRSAEQEDLQQRHSEITVLVYANCTMVMHLPAPERLPMMIQNCAWSLSPAHDLCKGNRENQHTYASLPAACQPTKQKIFCWARIPASKGEFSCVNKTHGDWNNCPTEDLGRPAEHNHSGPEAHRYALFCHGP